MQEEELKRERARLIERNKELTCLYEIAKIMADKQKNFPQMLQAILVLLPPAFQHPDRTGARIAVGDLTFATEGFEISPHMIREPLMIQGRAQGVM